MHASHLSTFSGTSSLGCTGTPVAPATVPLDMPLTVGTHAHLTSELPVSDRSCRSNTTSTVGADVALATRSVVPVLVTAPLDLAYRLARRIHESSARRNGPFVSIEEGAEPPDDAELPLTVAANQAAGGTLFVHVLGVLDERVQRELRSLLAVGRPTVEANGGPAIPKPRVIVACAENLHEQVVSGRLDPSLFYRLNVIHLIATRRTPILMLDSNESLAMASGRSVMNFQRNSLLEFVPLNAVACEDLSREPMLRPRRTRRTWRSRALLQYEAVR